MALQFLCQTIINLTSMVTFCTTGNQYIIPPDGLSFTIQVLLLILGVGKMCLVGQLSIFHIWLRYHGFTTFSLIQLQREIEQEELEREKEKIEGAKNKTGGTTHMQPSGHTANNTAAKDGLGKDKHVTSEHKNIISDEHHNGQNTQIQKQPPSKFIRRQVNLSSDQFLDINAVK